MAKRWGIVVAVCALAAGACGNSTTDSSQANGDEPVGPLGTVSAEDLTKNVPVDAPGVTDTAIKVGGVASTTNVLELQVDQAFKGAQAYFDMVNSQGGIYGRQLELVAERDDQMVNNAAEVQGLISQDEVFAILPVATLLFGGAQTAADAGIPTFGWNINPEWGGPPNLFNEKGYICIDCATPAQPWLAQEIGATKVGLLSYAVDQSADCAEGVKKSFEKWPTAELAYSDAVPYGATDLSVQVSKMREAGVDFVTTCMDANGSVTLAKELKAQQLDIPQYMQNAYDQRLLDEFGDVLEGGYVLTIPASLEVPDPPEGLRNFKEWIAKVPGAEANELSLAGWLNADLFYRGLVGAGPEFSQAKVIAAINQMEDWNADGIVPHVNWTFEHDELRPESCGVISQVQDGAFVPIFAEPGKPFTCTSNTADELVTEHRG